MPVLSFGHILFWDGTPGSSYTYPVPTPAAGAAFGYPAWQASVTTGSLFGALDAWLRATWTFLRWWIRLGRRLRRLDMERRRILDQVIAAVESPTFPRAQDAVQATAQMSGFRGDRQTQNRLNDALRVDVAQTENVFRHLQAVTLVKAGHRVSNPEAHLMVELAYQGFARRPKGQIERRVIVERS